MHGSCEVEGTWSLVIGSGEFFINQVALFDDAVVGRLCRRRVWVHDDGPRGEYGRHVWEARRWEEMRGGKVGGV